MLLRGKSSYLSNKHRYFYIHGHKRIQHILATLWQLDRVQLQFREDYIFFFKGTWFSQFINVTPIKLSLCSFTYDKNQLTFLISDLQGNPRWVVPRLVPGGEYLRKSWDRMDSRDILGIESRRLKVEDGGRATKRNRVLHLCSSWEHTHLALRAC